MTILALVLATADVNPEVSTVTGLHDELVKVDVGLEP